MRTLARNLFILFLISANGAVAETLLIENVIIVSAERPAPLQNASVLIEDGVITGVLGVDELPAAERVIDGRGRFLTPGLIDSHVHLGGNAGMRHEHRTEHAALLRAFYEREPLNYLAFGFTTLIDVSSGPRFAKAWNQRPLRPDLHFCIGIPFANGYGMAFEPMEVRFKTPYFLYDPDQSELIPEQYEPEDHTPVAVIDKVARTKAICVKTYYEEGYGGLFDFPVPPLDLIRELVQEAHREGLIVVMHTNALRAYEFGADAGVDVLAHGPWHWDQWNAERTVNGPARRILDTVIERGLAIQLTAQVVYGERELLDGGFLYDPRLPRIYHRELLDWYRSDAGNWFKRRLQNSYETNPEIVTRFIGRPPTGHPSDATQAGIDRLKVAAAYLDAQGASFVFGSDTPSSPTYTNPPGYNGLLEIRRLVELGFSARQIFESLTINNARRFGLDAEIGTVETGKKANLLLLRRNPLDSATAYDELDLVVIGGRVVDRDDLFLPTASRFKSSTGQADGRRCRAIYSRSPVYSNTIGCPTTSTLTICRGSSVVR